MLTPSSGTLADYNSAILNNNQTHVRLTFPVQGVVLTDSDIDMDGGITITDILNADTDLTMGRAVAREIVICLNNSNTFTGFDWTEEFQVEFGVDISGSTNWVTVGYFRGQKPEKVVRTEVIEFIAYDRMQNFDTLADDFLSTITYPETMANIYSALCSYLSLTEIAGDEMASAMGVIYSESPFVNGITLRTLLAYIAEANCCYAKITASGGVKLVWFSDQTGNYSVDGDDYYEANVDEADAPDIDMIRISSTEEEITGFVYPVGVSGEMYQIIDNPLMIFMSTADKTSVLTDMMTRFTAFGAYRPMSVVINGNWMIETGDIIEVAVGNDTFSMPVFGRNFVWNGGCQDEYATTGKTERTEMTESAKEQYEQGGRLATKYTIQSGIDITDEGITVSGGKFIKLISGGVLDVQALNFVVDSANKLVEIGNWTFDEDGLTQREEYSWIHSGQTLTALIDLYVGRHTMKDNDAVYGLYLDKDVITYGAGANVAPLFRFGAIDTRVGGANFSWELMVNYVNLPGELIPNGLPGNHSAIVPTRGSWVLGDPISGKFAGAVIEKFFGDVTFRNDGHFYNETTGRYARFDFKNNSANLGGGEVGGTIRLDFGNATNQTSNRMVFFEYSPKSTPDAGNTGNSEGYRLPAPTAGLNASANYDILTTKNPVTIAQGGTGQTTVAAARNALGLGNTSGALPVANGGTGATSASDARTNLGLGAAATRAVANNLTTTASGSVLDARQGKVLNDKIADIGSLFVVTTSTKAVGSSSPYSWSLTVNKSGYTPIMHTVYHNLASSATAGEEDASYGNGSATFSGFASRSGVTMTVKVLWVKNA